MEEFKLGNLTVTEKDMEFTTIIKKDNFTIKIPYPTEKATIIAQTSRALGGQNINSFPEEDYEYIRMLITLNNVIVDSPKWWKGADRCLDKSILNDLWKFYIDSENKFQDFLKKNNRPEEKKQS